MATVYRFILMSNNGLTADTGANYPGCSPNTTQMCDPKQFGGPTAIQQAVQYALSKDETPVQVQSAQEAWNLVSGQAPVQPASILASPGLDSTTLIILAIAGYFVLRGFR